MATVHTRGAYAINGTAFMFGVSASDVVLTRAKLLAAEAIHGLGAADALLSIMPASDSHSLLSIR
jgi:hypothetical protein